MIVVLVGQFHVAFAVSIAALSSYFHATIAYSIVGKRGLWTSPLVGLRVIATALIAALSS